MMEKVGANSSIRVSNVKKLIVISLVGVSNDREAGHEYLVRSF